MTACPIGSARRVTESLSDRAVGPTAQRQTAILLLSASVWLMSSSAAAAADWLWAKAYKLPSEYTNQESGYFSIIEGHNGKLYVGAAKYGVNGYLLEFDPKTEKTRMVMDVQETIG